MASVVHVEIVFVAVAICWLAANAPLIGTVIKNYQTPNICWQIFVSTPNRYLFSLIFMPALFFASFSTWEFLCYLLKHEQIPHDHVIRLFAGMQPSLLLAIAISSLVAFWDFTAGNFNNADFKIPFAQAFFVARDMILDNKTSENIILQPCNESHDVKAIANKLVLGKASLAEAQFYLVEVSKQRHLYIDDTMKNLNLINVWFFAFGTWLALYLSAMLGWVNLSTNITCVNHYWMGKYLSLFSIIIITIWTALRAYELKEYYDYMNTTSGESIDLLLGIMMVLFGCAFLSICFNKEFQSMVTFMLAPIAAVGTNYIANNYIRKWYGTSMSVQNFCILVFVCALAVIIMYAVFMKSKPC